MNTRKTVAVAASLLTMTAAAIGLSTPASAQGWHHDRDGGYRHGYAPGYHEFHGGYRHGYVAPHFYHRGPAVWSPGPGYVRRDWSWYNNQPGRWRAAHPYRFHGARESGIWIRL